MTSQRLAGALLSDIREDLSWSFTASEVVIENDGQLIQSDVVAALMEAQPHCSRIVAIWELQEDSGMLHLSIAEVDGEKTNREVTLPISPAGHVRVNLGSRQYNLVRSKVARP